MRVKCECADGSSVSARLRAEGQPGISILDFTFKIPTTSLEETPSWVTSISIRASVVRDIPPIPAQHNWTQNETT